MIYDRTAADVELAKSIRSNKVQNSISLTDEDVTALERGTLTINTLNRIEEKQAELKTLINNEGYYNINISNKFWSYNDIFAAEDLKRIINNDNILKNAFFVYLSTPQTPNAKYDYEVLNAIEEILYDLDVMINDVKSNYKECGAFECGEE